MNTPASGTSPQPWPTWTQLKGRLDSLGFRPSKRFGQNFLVEGDACRRTVAASGAKSGDFVLEVGVGPGLLTRHLLESGAQVLGVEIDGRLAELAGDLLAGRGDFELLHLDALAGKHALAPELLERLPDHGDWLLVANLPYSIASPLLVLLSALDHPPRSATILVQEEVAERLTAEPGHSEWGPLTARLGMVYRARRLFGVSRKSFRPKPQVENAVVQLERLEPSVEPAEGARVSRLIGRLFQQRRKQVLGVLAQVLGGDRALAGERLEFAGVEPERRVAQLTVGEWVALSAALPEDQHP